MQSLGVLSRWGGSRCIESIQMIELWNYRGSLPLTNSRKSTPVISTGMHISVRRERMRSPMRSPRVCSRAARSASVFSASAGRQVFVVGGDDGCLFVVVAGIQDQGHRIPYPLVGLLRAQIVQHQHLGGKDRLEQFQFGGLNLRVVAVLDAFEQLAIVTEEAP